MQSFVKGKSFYGSQLCTALLFRNTAVCKAIEKMTSIPDNNSSPIVIPKISTATECLTLEYLTVYFGKMAPMFPHDHSGVLSFTSNKFVKFHIRRLALWSLQKLTKFANLAKITVLYNSFNILLIIIWQGVSVNRW